MTRRAIIFSFFFAALVCASALPASAQVGNSIRGKVRNEAGRAMSQILVNLTTGTGTPVDQTVTNNEGDFFFGSLTDTSYGVSISQPDYEPYFESVSFSYQSSENQPGESHTVFITLTSKASVIPPPSFIFAQNVPPAARAAHDRGAALSKESKSAEAVAAYKEAIAAFPQYYDAHFALGYELLKLGRIDDSIAELEAARQINDKDDRVYACFGQALSQQKKFATAAAVYLMASQMRPKEPRYLLMRATALIDQVALMDTTPSPNAAERKQFLDAAAADLDQAYATSNQKLAAVHIQRARMHERLGNKKGAADSLETYLKQSPGAPNAAAIRESIKKLRAA
jgi:tetratricopeptide (TPR) repeat protein